MIIKQTVAGIGCTKETGASWDMPEQKNDKVAAMFKKSGALAAGILALELSVDTLKVEVLK
jgi:hypothetical protein